MRNTSGSELSAAAATRPSAAGGHGRVGPHRVQRTRSSCGNARGDQSTNTFPTAAPGHGRSPPRGGVASSWLRRPGERRAVLVVRRSGPGELSGRRTRMPLILRSSPAVEVRRGQELPDLGAPTPRTGGSPSPVRGRGRTRTADGRGRRSAFHRSGSPGRPGWRLHDGGGSVEGSSSAAPLRSPGPTAVASTRGGCDGHRFEERRAVDPVGVPAHGQLHRPRGRP